jgi:hypothetical protein
MTGDHHGQAAGTATLLVRAVDEISGTHNVRVSRAARRLYQLRVVLGAHDPSARPGARTARRIRWAERRAQSALIRAGFADAGIAAAVLCQVQVLARAATLARLDYRTPDAGQAAITSLITSPATAAPRLDADASAGHPAAPGGADGHDAQLVAAATRIVAAAVHAGDRLSQAALAGQLRREGYTVANGRLARGHGMRHCRYRGQPKAHLQHVLTAIADGIERLSQIPPGESTSPRPPTAFQGYLDQHHIQRLRS